MLLAPFATRAQTEDRVVAVAPGDAAMAAAIRQGRAGLPVFFAHVAAPGPDEDGFSVKFDVRRDPSAPEFIWAEIISHRPGETFVRLSNVPNDDRFALGQQAAVGDAEIVDWSYRRGGVAQGAFTTRALLATMNGSYAAQVRAAMGWD